MKESCVQDTPRLNYTYAPAPNYEARAAIPNDQWAWVVVRNTTMCVDNFNPDNLNWGLKPEIMTDPTNINPDGTFKEDDSNCQRRKRVEIMLNGGNWEPDPDMQQITRVNTIFRVPSMFLAGLGMTLPGAIEWGQQMFRDVAAGERRMTVPRQRQLLEEGRGRYL